MKIIKKETEINFLKNGLKAALVFSSVATMVFGATQAEKDALMALYDSTNQW